MYLVGDVGDGNFFFILASSAFIQLREQLEHHGREFLSPTFSLHLSILTAKYIIPLHLGVVQRWCENFIPPQSWRYAFSYQFNCDEI